VRFIKDWKINQLLLGFKHFAGSHDAKSIRARIDSLLVDEYQLPLHYVSVKPVRIFIIFSPHDHVELNIREC